MAKPRNPASDEMLMLDFVVVDNGHGLEIAVRVLPDHPWKLVANPELIKAQSVPKVPADLSVFPVLDMDSAPTRGNWMGRRGRMLRSR